MGFIPLTLVKDIADFFVSRSYKTKCTSACIGLPPANSTCFWLGLGKTSAQLNSPSKGRDAMNSPFSEKKSAVQISSPPVSDSLGGITAQ